jgi:hypothetical protein
MEVPRGEFYLGSLVDPATGKGTGEPLFYESGDLTTHGVIVGMTGSGKTGLGLIFLEEALLQGVPAIILDPKGDMGNLKLVFPEMRPQDFEPWVNEGDARQAGKPTAEFAADTAASWRSGLEGSGISGERIRQLAAGADVTIYTPGSSAGVPLNLLGSLARPSLSWETESETLRGEIESFVTSLLGMAGIDADPLSSREHILLANIIESAWRGGQDLDLGSLIGFVHRPPLRKLGVFDLDVFFPEKDRLAFAMRLNSLAASPSFASWLEGAPLDIGALLRAPDGRPRGSIVYLAHLSDAERQFVVTLILGKLITWMRAQSGTTDLRALLYMDELYGYAPPTENPPSKKPLLTLLKQARAFGVGLLLSTQNPVDLDYKALSNAGTWLIGRLQTEQDKARILDGLRAAAGGVDIADIDRRISALGKRQFVLNSAHESGGPRVMQTRWAISYLRGPLTREQISRLTSDADRTPAPTGPAAAAAPPPGVDTPAAAPAETGDATPVAPPAAAGVPVFYLDAGAPWASEVGATPGGKRLEAAIAARVSLLYDDTQAGIEHREEWEAVYLPLSRHFDASSGVTVDYDDRDFRPEPPPGALYVLPEAPIGDAAYFRQAGAQIKEHLVRERSVEIYRNAALKLFSRVGESQEDFAARCDRAASEMADRDTAELRERMEARIDRVRDAIAAAERQADQLQADTASRGQQELIAGAGAILSVLLGGKANTRSMASRAGRVLGGFSSRRAASTRAAGRREAAEAKVAEKMADLEALEADLAEKITEIDDRWRDAAADIQPVPIGLEKTDVSVTQVALVWIPTSRPGL